jgi:MFS family permease
MIWGTLILIAMAFLNAGATTFVEFLAYRTIQSVSSSMWMTSRTTLLADILRPEERGRIMGYFQTFQLLVSTILTQMFAVETYSKRANDIVKRHRGLEA